MDRALALAGLVFVGVFFGVCWLADRYLAKVDS